MMTLRSRPKKELWEKFTVANLQLSRNRWDDYDSQIMSAMETAATQLNLNTIMNIHNCCWWITKMVMWGTEIGFCRLPKTRFLQATRAGGTDKCGLFVWNIGQFYINQKLFLNLTLNKIPEQHGFHTQRQRVDQKEARVLDAAVPTRSTLHCMILLKLWQCLHPILVIICLESERKNLEAICDNTAKFSFSSHWSYSNYWPFQCLNGISKCSGMPLPLSNGTF